MQIKILLLLLFATSTLLATQENKIEEIHWYIFVHGIMDIENHLSINNCIYLFNDDIENTVYKETVSYIRQNPFFFKNQPMQQIGLHKIDMNNTQKGYASGAVARIFELQLYKKKPTIKNYYYTFGWSSLLSYTARYEAAKLLYDALEKEITRYDLSHTSLKITAIGYSHGSNVLLNLAAIKHKESKQPLWKIDQLVLFGTPIQNETDHYVADSLFGKIYHLYSSSDRAQTLDFFSHNRFFSDRIFRKRKDFEPPNNLFQINLQVLRREGGNINNHFHRCRKKPCVSPVMRTASPGHTELWFFGWIPSHYRKSFPLYPLSMVALTPTILHFIQDAEHLIKPIRPAQLTIDTFHNRVWIRNNKKEDIVFEHPWISPHLWHEMTSIAYAYKPTSSTRAAFRKQCAKALAKARQWHKSYVKKEWEQYYCSHCKSFHNRNKS